MQVMPSDSRTALEGQLLRFLEAASEHAVILLRADGIIEGWFGAAQRQFGYSTDEAKGLDIGVLFTPEDRRMGLDRQEIRTAIASGRSEDERWHLRKDGSRFWGSGVLEAMREPDGSVPLLCKMMRDRTDVRTQFVAMQNRLRRREKEREELAGYIVSIGHEMRNVVSPMQNAATLIGMTDDSLVRKRSLDVLQRQLDAMSKLLADLSHATHPEVERFRLDRRPVVVQDAIEEAVESVRTLVEQRRLQLVSTLPLIRFAIDADPQRLQQMLLNLLGNAIKFTAPGGHVTISASIEADMAVIRVTDDGMGIAPELLPRIFELFTRDDTREMPPGMGVGLAVVKELATMHGGSIEARSPGLDKGSIFALRLPLAYGQHEAEPDGPLDEPAPS